MQIRKRVAWSGGIVPWHSSDDRPALIYIVPGTIQEHSSNCSEPVEHKSGEISVEKLAIAALLAGRLRMHQKVSAPMTVRATPASFESR